MVSPQKGQVLSSFMITPNTATANDTPPLAEPVWGSETSHPRTVVLDLVVLG
jgi:hypothetical protein